MSDGHQQRRITTAGRAALWSMFALLVLSGGWLFLRACGTYPVLGWARNFCPAPANGGAYAREVADGQSLQRQVHSAEMALAEIPPCAPPAPPPAPIVMPPPGPHVTPQRSAESKKLDETVKKRGGKTGRLQFTLAWNTRDDLDINVDCPGGRIGSRAGQTGPGICGDGVKDIDANRNLRENMSSSPIENISWSGDVPDGTYSIEIIEYRPQTNRGNVVPFTLRMRWGDQEKICRDVVSTLADADVRRNGSQIIAGSYRTIAWRSGTDLPDCDFTHQDSIRGPAK